MKDDSQASTSIWMATANTPSPSRLKESIRTDVCIIGAGIAGLTTAYLLGREGRSVVVLDDGAVGGGMTGRTTAHLTNAYDDRYVEIEKMHGGEASCRTAESHTAAIDKVSEIVSREKIACEFEWLDGFLFAQKPDDVQLLEDELAASHRAGLVGVEKVARAPINSFDTGVALRFPRQAQFHPLRYLDGLARAIMRDGGRIFGETHATKVEGGQPARVETSNGPVVNSEVVIVSRKRLKKTDLCGKHGFASKVGNHSWIGSVQGAIATWLVISTRYFLTIFDFYGLTRSLPLPVLTRSKCDSYF